MLIADIFGFCTLRAAEPLTWAGHEWADSAQQAQKQPQRSHWAMTEQSTTVAAGDNVTVIVILLSSPVVGISTVHALPWLNRNIGITVSYIR